MKRFLTLIVSILSVTISFSQEISFEHLATMTKAPSGKFDSYVASDKFTYKIGDKIKIGVPSSNKSFAFITEGDGMLVPITNLTSSSSGQVTEIKKIWIDGSKRAGWRVLLRTKGLTGLSNYTIQFENALSVGEIKGYGKSSDEALGEIKKAKEKFELGLMTEEEYNAVKEEMKKYLN